MPFLLQQQLERCQKEAVLSAPSIDPVLDAFEDALVNPCPSVRYLIPGSKSFFDKDHVSVAMKASLLLNLILNIEMMNYFSLIIDLI